MAPLKADKALLEAMFAVWCVRERVYIAPFIPQQTSAMRTDVNSPAAYSRLIDFGGQRGASRGRRQVGRVSRWAGVARGICAGRDGRLLNRCNTHTPSSGNLAQGCPGAARCRPVQHLPKTWMFRVCARVRNAGTAREQLCWTHAAKLFRTSFPPMRANYNMAAATVAVMRSCAPLVAATWPSDH